MYTNRKERFLMVLRRANCDRLDRSSWPFCPCSNCVCELALPSVGSMLIEPAREFVFSIAAISSKQLKNDCFCSTQLKCHSIYSAFIVKFGFHFNESLFPILFCFFGFTLRMISAVHFFRGGRKWFMMIVVFMCISVADFGFFVVLVCFYSVLYFTDCVESGVDLCICKMIVISKKKRL